MCGGGDWFDPSGPHLSFGGVGQVVSPGDCKSPAYGFGGSIPLAPTFDLWQFGKQNSLWPSGGTVETLLGH